LPPPDGLSQLPTPFVRPNCSAAVVGSVTVHQPAPSSVKATSAQPFQSPRR